MKDNDPVEDFINVLSLLCIVVAVSFLLIEFYLFYFASCSTLGDYWLIVQMPGRCIHTNLLK